ncbi:MAG: KpsF/GutQ family sugar-phosphate isomerase [Planctomycetota bacterium]|nr:KpsF/GutQ family sugar-phosphate isomerase [Planctomycetota bacterium]
MINTPSAVIPSSLSPFEQIRYARQILHLESQALQTVAERLDTEFCRAVDRLYLCSGNVIVTGIGKAGLIGQKLAATLASTGTRSHFLHPAEAVHGDLGQIHREDVVLILSQSGETEEVIRLLPSLAEIGVSIIAITGRRNSTLGRASSVVIELGPLKEACSLGLAPSTSTTAMLGMGDALALVTSRMRSFGREDFARFHPGGNLGRQLSKVEEYMRKRSECRIATTAQSVRDVLVQVRAPGRRSGAIMIVDEEGVLRGIFTDSDLARMFESRRDQMLDDPIRLVMTRSPATVTAGSMMTDAVEVMAERKISELPVVDVAGRPIGMLDITDIVSLFPVETPSRDGRPTGIARKIVPAAPAPSAVQQSANLTQPVQSTPAGGTPRPKSQSFFDNRRTSEHERT